MKQAPVPSCDSHRAQINLVDLDKVSDAQLNPFLDWLNPDELLRYQRFGRKQRAQQFLAGRVLLRWSLMQMTGLPLSCITLTERPQNAPLLHMAGLASPPAFSLSHSANWVACACSSSVRLGLDIEMLDPSRNLLGMARHSFDAPELEWMQAQPDQVQAFYFLWSCREARYKLTQSHVSTPVEYCYALHHPAASLVLMTEQALQHSPDCVELDWATISVR